MLIKYKERRQLRRKKRINFSNSINNVNNLISMYFVAIVNKYLLFRAHHCHFTFKDPCLLASLASALAALIYLKIQLRSLLTSTEPNIT